MGTNKELFKSIAQNYLAQEDANLAPYACRSSDGSRRNPEREKIADALNIRPTFFHDTDKIIHSLAFTRYIDKTQVFYLFENDHITHRALHVQFVAKIGRVIARCLHLNEDLVEAIALGHDIGHPPYGHDGERILHQLCQEHNIGSYLHNVQSVRALTYIEQRGAGKNLSLQVLDGILTHNGEMLTHRYEPDFTKDWDRFTAEYESCYAGKTTINKRIRPMTLEGCVARICDIIAYIGRDIEDAITLKLIKRDDVPEKFKSVLGATNDAIINTLVTDLIAHSYQKPYLEFSATIFDALNELKSFNYQKIYSNERIKTEGKKIENMYRQLFDHYCKDIETRLPGSKLWTYLDGMGEHYHTSTPSLRKIIDFIAGMTDDFFNNEYATLFVPQSFGYAL